MSSPVPSRKLPPAPNSTQPYQHVFKQKTVQIANFEKTKDLDRALAKFRGVDPFFKKPLVCTRGSDRPPLVAEFQGGGVCAYGAAQSLMKLARQLYETSCQKPWDEAKARIQRKISIGEKLDQADKDYLTRSNQRVSLDMYTMIKVHPFSDSAVKLPNSSNYNFQPTTCGEAQYSIPILLENFGFEDPQSIHPFYQIVFHLNADQLHDFRSAQAFKDAAVAMGPLLKQSGTRELKAVYPASGSHLAALGVAFQLMDAGQIDRASFQLSEIDANSAKRIGSYLELMTKMPVRHPGASQIRALITHLKKQEKQDMEGQWQETTFSFNYRGKPIQLRIFNNTKKGKYIADSYLKDANLLVLHDMVENPSEEDRLLKTMGQIQEKRQGKSPAFVLGAKKPPTAPANVRVQEFKGKYGCGPVDTTGKIFGEDTWTWSAKGPEHTLLKGARTLFDPFESHSDLSPIKVHYNQRSHPFYLHTWN